MNGSEQQDRLVGDQHEYAALTGFLAQANGFRFTVLGLFLAMAGFVLQQPARSTALLVLILSVLLWGSELRTRAILHSLMLRGLRLEGTTTPNPNHATERPETALPFVHALGTMKGQKTWIGPPPREDGAGHERRTVSLPAVVSHTTMIDLIYLAVFLYCAAVLFFGPENFQFQPN